jgi:hypothetical protein
MWFFNKFRFISKYSIWPNKNWDLGNWIYFIGILFIAFPALVIMTTYISVIPKNEIIYIILVWAVVSFLFYWLIQRDALKRRVFDFLDSHSLFYKICYYGSLIGCFTIYPLFLFVPLYIIAVIYDALFY